MPTQLKALTRIFPCLTSFWPVFKIVRKCPQIPTGIVIHHFIKGLLKLSVQQNAPAKCQYKQLNNNNFTNFDTKLKISYQNIIIINKKCLQEAHFQSHHNHQTQQTITHILLLHTRTNTPIHKPHPRPQSYTTTPHTVIDTIDHNIKKTSVKSKYL